MRDPLPIPDQFAVSIGEILWDVTGNQRYLGGAPFNFAYHCKAMGVRSAIISSISSDDLGADLLHQAHALGVDTSRVQRNAKCPTGVVQAECTPDNTVTYTFPAECAWDHIHFHDQDRALIDQAHIINFGTLAQRSIDSRSAIMAALASTPRDTIRFLDLNLRVPYYDRDTIHRSLEAADVVKMNTWELEEVKNLLHVGGTEDFALAALLDKYELEAIVITRGADGAFALSHTNSAHVDGYKVDVADTIGCGDAFGAGFIIKLVEGASLQEAVETANAAGAYVATQAGGTPLYTANDIVSFRNEHPKPLKEGANL